MVRVVRHPGFKLTHCVPEQLWVTGEAYCGAHPRDSGMLAPNIWLPAKSRYVGCMICAKHLPIDVEVKGGFGSSVTVATPVKQPKEIPKTLADLDPNQSVVKLIADGLLPKTNGYGFIANIKDPELKARFIKRHPNWQKND